MKLSPLTSRQRAVIIILWGLFLGGIVAGIVFFMMVYNGAIGYMPPVEELKNPTDRFASVVYSADGQELGRYFRNTGNRVYADFDEISENVVNALVATRIPGLRNTPESTSAHLPASPSRHCFWGSAMPEADRPSHSSSQSSYTPPSQTDS